MRTQEEISIGDVVHAVGVSNPTVKKVLDHYIDLGLVELSGKGDSTNGGGKRPDLYRLNRMYGYSIALHVGPDFLYAALVNVKLETIQAHSESIDGSHSAEEVINRLVEIANTFRTMMKREGIKIINVVIALPGIVNEVNGNSYYSPHYPQWEYNYPFKKMFEKKFQTKAPVYLDGVNRLQAIGELMIGKAKEKKNFLILDAMPEGVGAGILVEGQLTHGYNHISGEVGHIIVDPQGPACICGGTGCFEAAVSMNHIQHLILKEYTKDSINPLFEGRKPEDISLKELFDAAYAENLVASSIINQLINYFAVGLNSILAVVDAELVVFQGIFTVGGPRFLEEVKRRLTKMALPYLPRKYEFVYTDFGEERGAVGAGCFGIAQFFDLPNLYV